MKHLHDIPASKPRDSFIDFLDEMYPRDPILPTNRFIVHPAWQPTAEQVRRELDAYTAQIREMNIRMNRVDGYFTVTTTGGGWGGGGTGGTGRVTIEEDRGTAIAWDGHGDPLLWQRNGQ